MVLFFGLVFSVGPTIVVLPSSIPMGPVLEIILPTSLHVYIKLKVMLIA